MLVVPLMGWCCCSRQWIVPVWVHVAGIVMLVAGHKVGGGLATLALLWIHGVAAIVTVVWWFVTGGLRKGEPAKE